MTCETAKPTTCLSFLRYFGNLRDPRRACRTTYRFLDLIFIALVATIAGANDAHAIAVFASERRIWLQKYCQLPVDPETNEIVTPSHDTFERLFKRLNPVAFARCFGRWTAALAESLGLKQVAIDGKCLRGSRGASEGLKALHLVQAWSTENHLSLGQVAVSEKSNEITAIPKLLQLLEIKGALVTIDAMGTQKKIAAQIIAAEADYVLPVKGNQPNLLEEISQKIEAAKEIEFAQIEHDIYQTEERGHGRTEKRTYIVLYDLEDMKQKQHWERLEVIGLCIREREQGGKRSVENHYFIGSRKMTAKEYAQTLRGHWGIENNLHWHLDVHFSEDANQVADRHLAQNLAAIRRHALALLKRHPSKLSIPKKRYKATLNQAFIEQVLQLA